jgi:hypothetical protein
MDAVAVLQAFEQVEQAAGEREALLELGNFASGEFSPAHGNRSAFAEAVEEEFDLGEGEIHFASEADQEDAVKGFAGIAALAADAVGRREQAELFVVADRGRREAGFGGEVSDFHRSAPVWSAWKGFNKSPLDLKSALTFSILDATWQINPGG